MLTEDVRILQNLNPPVSSADWDRFDYYAAKILSLGYFMLEFPDQGLTNWLHYWMIHYRRPASDQCMQTLCVYRRQAFILPNLRRLRLTVYDVTFLPYVPMLLSTHLQELSIAFYREQVTGLPKIYEAGRLYGETLPSLLESLPVLCPSLSDLAIFTQQSSHVTNSALSFVSTCKDLTGFFVVSTEPSQELILRLAEQTHLRKVYLSLDEETSDISWLQSTVRYPFPSLDTLEMRTPTLQSCTCLITLMGDCTLRLVRFDVYEGAPPADDLQALFEAFRDHCPSRTLQFLHINYELERSGTKVILKPEDHSLTGEVVSSLYPFSRMRFFRLHIPLVCFLDDQDLMDMADHWPLLIELRLLDDWEWGTGPFNTTWTGVVYLAWKCRQLIELALAWDMRADNAAEITSRQGFRRSTSLRFINCLDSVTCDIEVCARNVHAFAPLIWDIWGIGFGEPQPEEDMARLPPEQDPIAFYEAVVAVLRASYAAEEVDMYSLASQCEFTFVIRLVDK